MLDHHALRRYGVPSCPQIMPRSCVQPSNRLGGCGGRWTSVKGRCPIRISALPTGDSTGSGSPAEDPQLPSLPARFLLSECGPAPSVADVPPALPHLTPDQLVDAVGCFEAETSPELMEAVAQEIRNQLPQFRVEHLCSTLKAFAKLKFQPSEQWWQDFEERVSSSLTDLTVHQAAELVWSFAVLDRGPTQETRLETEAKDAVRDSASAVWLLDLLLSRSCEKGFFCYSPGRLHQLMWALGHMQHTPSAAWLTAYLQAAEAALFLFKPAHIAEILWALARLGVELPADWLDKVLTVAQWRFPSFSAHQLSIMAWSTATLKHRPRPDWLMCFDEQVCARFSEFSDLELQCVAWSLQCFGYSEENNTVLYMIHKLVGFVL